MRAHDDEEDRAYGDRGKGVQWAPVEATVHPYIVGGPNPSANALADTPPPGGVSALPFQRRPAAPTTMNHEELDLDDDVEADSDDDDGAYVVGSGGAVGERLDANAWQREADGTIQEGMVDEAKAKRAQSRRAGADDESKGHKAKGVWERYEEDYDAAGEWNTDGGDKEGGVRVEPFNLKRERARGDIDEDGNFTRVDRLLKRHRARAEGQGGSHGNDDDDDAPPAAAADDGVDDDDDDDGEDVEPEEQGDAAWFAAAQVARPEVAEQHKRQFSALSDAGQTQATQHQTAMWMRELAAHLEFSEETVSAALRRLGGKSAKNNKSLPLALRRAAEKAGAANKAKIEDVTRLSMSLMDAGEMDIYEHTKRQLDRMADVVLGSPGQQQPGNVVVVGVGGVGANNANTPTPVVDDMFADDDDE